MIIVVLIVFLIDSQICFCKTNCRLSNLDNKMKSMTTMLGDGNAKWPENEQQKLEFCRYMHDEIAHAKFFKSKCYSGISRSLIKFIITANEYTNMKLSCKNTEEMNRFLERGKCGNRGKKETAKCWSDWIGKLTLIKNMTDDAIKPPLLCCSLNEWKKCSHDVYRGLGSKVCSKKSIDGFDNYMKRSVVDPINIIFHCDEQDKKQCSIINNLISNKRKSKSRYKTPFPLILDITHQTLDNHQDSFET